MFLRFPARRQGMREKVLPISACSRRSRNDKAIVEKSLERPLHGSWRLSERRGKLLNPLCIDLVKKSAQRDLRSRESGRARRDLTGSLYQSVCIEDPGRHACDGDERLGLVVERPAEHDAAQRDLRRDPASRLRRRGRGPQPPRRVSGRGGASDEALSALARNLTDEDAETFLAESRGLTSWVAEAAKRIWEQRRGG